MANKPKFRDPRNDIMNVFDTQGVSHQMTLTNAREMVRFSGWTLDAVEAATRRGAETETAPVAIIADAPVAPVWEDLSTVSKAALTAAVREFKIEAKIDGRTSEKRIATFLETELDKRLAQSGDFDGADPVAEGDAAEAIAAKQTAAVARRRRAFALAAKAIGGDLGDLTLVDYLAGFEFVPAEQPATETVVTPTEPTEQKAE